MIASLGSELVLCNKFNTINRDNVVVDNLNIGGGPNAFRCESDFWRDASNSNSMEKNTLDLIINCFEDALETAVHNVMDYGFLLSNFINEFNGRNPEIMKHLNEILRIWEVTLVTAIQRGKFNGHIDRHVDAEGVAVYLMSSYIGIRTLMVETSPSARKYRFMSQIRQYFKAIETKQASF